MATDNSQADELTSLITNFENAKKQSQVDEVCKKVQQFLVACNQQGVHLSADECQSIVKICLSRPSKECLLLANSVIRSDHFDSVKGQSGESSVRAFVDELLKVPNLNGIKQLLPEYVALAQSLNEKIELDLSTLWSQLATNPSLYHLCLLKGLDHQQFFKLSPNVTLLMWMENYQELTCFKQEVAFYKETANLDALKQFCCEMIALFLKSFRSDEKVNAAISELIATYCSGVTEDTGAVRRLSIVKLFDSKFGAQKLGVHRAILEEIANRFNQPWERKEDAKTQIVSDHIPFFLQYIRANYNRHDVDKDSLFKAFKNLLFGEILYRNPQLLTEYADEIVDLYKRNGCKTNAENCTYIALLGLYANGGSIAKVIIEDEFEYFFAKFSNVEHPDFSVNSLIQKFADESADKLFDVSHVHKLETLMEFVPDHEKTRSILYLLKSLAIHYPKILRGKGENYHAVVQRKDGSCMQELNEVTDILGKIALLDEGEAERVLSCTERQICLINNEKFTANVLNEWAKVAQRYKEPVRKRTNLLKELAKNHSLRTDAHRVLRAVNRFYACSIL